LLHRDHREDTEIHREKITKYGYFCTVIVRIMECRSGCGACCIALSISSPLPGMVNGKPAGVKCIHLTDDYRCAIYTDTAKPGVCTGFIAEPDFCGSGREEAMEILGSLSDAPVH
jgi:hypothetical protein